MKLLPICLLFLLLAVSCKKQEEAPPLDEPYISVNNFPDDADTLHMYINTVLHIRIKDAPYPKYILKVLYPSWLCMWDSSYDGTFRIPVDRICPYPWYFLIRFEAYGGPSDQSFSQINTNGIYITRREVILNYTSYFQIPPPVLAETNGTLEGRIHSFTLAQAIAVYKFYNSPGTNVRIDSITPVSPGEFIFTDNSYVGEQAYYSLKGYIMNDSADYSYSGGGSAERPKEISPHTIQNDVNGWPVIKWNKNRYSQNFGSYRIRKDKGYGTPAILKETADINDTVQTGMDLGFPGPVGIYVTHLPKNNLEFISTSLELEDYGFKVTYTPGDPIRPFDEMGSPRGNDIYLYQDNDSYLYRYSTLNHQKTDSIACETGRFAVSPNNKFVLTLHDDRFHLYNVETGQDISILVSDYLPVNGVGRFDVSDIGTMVVMNDFEDLKLIDVVHDQLLGTIEMFNYTENICQISPGGDYVHVYTNDKNRIYRYSGGTFTEVYNTGSFGFDFLRFIPDQPGKILLILTGGYEIYNLVMGTSEYSASWISPFQEISIDFNDYQIMTHDDNYYKIYELNTGTVVKSIIHNIYSKFTYLNRHTLYHGSGSWLKFQEK